MTSSLVGSEMCIRDRIIIAQRILSVQNADIILVIEKGKVVASGNHETLVRQEGLYRDLYLTQGGVVDEK